MTDWRDAGSVKLRLVLSKYDDETVKYTYIGSLGSLLQDDDGGLYGYESAQAEAAQEVDGDPSEWEEWQVESVEYCDEGI